MNGHCPKSNFMFRRKWDCTPQPPNRPTVVLLDKAGSPSKRFKSAAVAARDLNTDPESVQDCCNGLRHQVNLNVFRWEHPNALQVTSHPVPVSLRVGTPPLPSLRILVLSYPLHWLHSPHLGRNRTDR